MRVVPGGTVKSTAPRDAGDAGAGLLKRAGQGRGLIRE